MYKKLAAIVTCGLLGFLIGYGIWLSGPVAWRAKVLFECRDPGLSGSLAGDENLRALIQGFPQAVGGLHNEGSAMEKIRGCIRVSPIRGTDLKQLEVIHSDSETVILMANALPEIARKIHEEHKTRERTIIYKELETKFADASSLLEEARARLDATLRKHGMEPSQIRLEPANTSPEAESVPEILQARQVCLEAEKRCSQISRDKLAAAMAGPCMDLPAIQIWQPAVKSLPVRQNLSSHLVIGSLAGLLSGVGLVLSLGKFRRARCV